MRMRVVIVAALLVTAGLVGCGGNDNDSGVASANGSTSSPSSSASTGSKGSDRDQELRYAQCMRENGVPNFPDPDENGGLGVDLNELGVDQAKFEAADSKCKHNLPNGGVPQKLDPEQLEQLRTMAQCMRKNGFPDFPDPTDEGFQLNANEHPEWNPDDPKFKAAQEKCNDEAGIEGGVGSTDQSEESA